MAFYVIRSCVCVENKVNVIERLCKRGTGKMEKGAGIVFEEEKFIKLDFTKEEEMPRWSLFDSEHSTFNDTWWFHRENYQILRVWEIKEKYFHKNSKLSEKKLKEKGYIKVETATRNDAVDWIITFLKIPALSAYFEKQKKSMKEDIFIDFIQIADIVEEVTQIGDWLRYFYSVQWCERKKIPFKLYLPEDFPEKPNYVLRKKMVDKIFTNNYYEPFDFLNKWNKNIDYSIQPQKLEPYYCTQWYTKNKKSYFCIDVHGKMIAKLFFQGKNIEGNVTSSDYETNPAVYLFMENMDAGSEIKDFFLFHITISESKMQWIDDSGNCLYEFYRKK